MDSLSPKSRSKRADTGADPEITRKKKVRGRPLKSSGSSNVPEVCYTLLLLLTVFGNRLYELGHWQFNRRILLDSVLRHRDIQLLNLMCT